MTLNQLSFCSLGSGIVFFIFAILWTALDSTFCCIVTFVALAFWIFFALKLKKKAKERTILEVDKDKDDCG